MASHNTNVVRLSGSGRDPTQRIIDECRDRLTEHLAKWLQSIGSEVAEELFVLADSTRDRLKQTQYLDLRRQVETEWADVTHASRRAFLDAKPTPDVALSVPDFEGLKLIDDAELSEGIVLRELSARIAETCDDELYSLDRRMALLLGNESLDSKDIEHPLRPEFVCDALATGCAALATSTENRTLLLRRIERHLHLALPLIYRGINAYLIELGVLPDLKRSYRRAGAPSLNSPAPVAETLPQIQLPTSAFPPVPAPAGNGDFLAVLQRLAMSRTTDSNTMNPGSPAMNALGQGVVGQAVAATQASVADAAALSQAFFASLEQFRYCESEGTANQIHVIRNSEAARQVGHVESVTIDIVAMLFDFIFDDKALPDGVKSLVGRLQIPVLKLAMQDSDFFADRHHPARHFLDEISGIALRWGGNVDTEDPFYTILADLIGRIQDGFENDVEIFRRALDELQAFVDSQSNVEDETANTATELAELHEREAASWEHAQAAVRELTRTEIPELIKNFALDQWLFVLQKIALESDATGSAWDDHLSLIPDLAASILPLKTNEERIALIRNLPGLLGRINRGLDLVSTDKNERRPFFDALVDLHTTALKGETPSLESLAASFAEPTPEAVASESMEMLSNAPPDYDTNSPAGDLIVTRSLNNGVEVEEITLVGAKPMWRADQQDIGRQVAQLKRGDWVEFRQEDGPPLRERLTWTSPRGRILVFSNHRAAKAISIAPEALAHLIRNDQAAIIEDESLFERAMTGVLENLSAQ